MSCDSGLAGILLTIKFAREAASSFARRAQFHSTSLIQGEDQNLIIKLRPLICRLSLFLFCSRDRKGSSDGRVYN